jgi:hypothetical protein
LQQQIRDVRAMSDVSLIAVNRRFVPFPDVRKRSAISVSPREAATISEPQDNRSRLRADIAKLPDLQGKPQPPLSYLS